ncbi:hypothetical protein BKA63DRAFT_140399 [Paraphoma chrysanthemicola]|nr:hypothetical protein BKA63DRAFT_140399 [Paraphoma chrysanthemicola]
MLLFDEREGIQLHRLQLGCRTTVGIGHVVASTGKPCLTHSENPASYAITNRVSSISLTVLQTCDGEKSLPVLPTLLNPNCAIFTVSEQPTFDTLPSTLVGCPLIAGHRAGDVRELQTPLSAEVRVPVVAMATFRSWSVVIGGCLSALRLCPDVLIRHDLFTLCAISHCSDMLPRKLQKPSSRRHKSGASLPRGIRLSLAQISLANCAFAGQARNSIEISNPPLLWQIEDGDTIGFNETTMDSIKEAQCRSPPHPVEAANFLGKRK